MNSLMNKLFRVTSFYQHGWWTYSLGQHLSVAGAQQQMAKDLMARE